MIVAMIVTMTVAVAVAFAGVGAGFRFKRQMRESDLQAELAQHIVQHMIVVIAQLSGHDLQRNVAVAEVIAGFRQGERIVAMHHGHAFICGDNLHKLAAVFIAEHIPAA